MIAISATDKKLTTSMDIRFGRAPYFLLTDGETSRFVSNPFCEEESDIGPRLVEFLKEKEVTRIVTGEVGPKAKAKLDELKIQIIMLSEDKISLQHILKKMNLLR